MTTAAATASGVGLLLSMVAALKRAFALLVACAAVSAMWKVSIL